MTSDAIDAFGTVNNEMHGQDAFLVEKQDGVTLVGVADGASDGGTQESAPAVIQLARRTFRDCASMGWDQYRHTLMSSLLVPTVADTATGLTTLTLLWLSPPDGGTVRANFLAIGDSPIFRALPGPIAPELPESFLIYVVHGSPRYRADEVLYSYVDLTLRAVVGRVHTGALELYCGDVCLVCSDGVPLDSPFVFKDYGAAAASHRFLNAVRAQGSRVATTELFETMRERGAFKDDAALVTICVREDPDVRPERSDVSHNGEIDYMARHGLALRQQAMKRSS